MSTIMNVKPITPDEVSSEKQKLLPPAVLQVFNDLIAKNWTGRESRILQEDAVKAICLYGYTREEVYSNAWLDVEDIYRQSGWKVEYDKPAYNESYKAFFKFYK